jgi:hypothetical protein
LNNSRTNKGGLKVANGMTKMFRKRNNNWGAGTMLSLLGVGIGAAAGYSMAKGMNNEEKQIEKFEDEFLKKSDQLSP